MSVRRWMCALALVSSCRGCPDRSPDIPAPAAIEVTTGGTVAIRVVPGHPCRATVEGVEMIVGGRPLVSQLGNARWTGDDAANGTTLRTDGAPVARIYPISDAREIAVFDPVGVPMIRVIADGAGATVSDHQSAVVRKIGATPTGLAVREVYSVPPPRVIEASGAGPPAALATATGTTDALLVGVVTSPELTREVRALAACSRLMPPEGR